jgi:probable HAF family extracellular repeat protein
VPGRSTRANNASFDGSTIVGWQDSSTGFRQGAVWSGGTQTLMVDANGNLMGELGDVSADGTWAVGSGVSSNGFVAYRWSAATGVQTLGPNLVPGDRSSATGISNDGSVIVGFSRPLGPATFGRGFIWSEGTGMLNLNTVAAAQGINTGGVIMALPLTISGDGLTVGGVTNAGSGFILRLTSPIPEPSTMLSMAFGVLALAGWALRRNRGAASAAV